MSKSNTVFSLCLQAGEDLKESIEDFVLHNNLKACFVITCVGTLKSVTLGLNATPKFGPPFPSLEKVAYTILHY